MKTAVFGYGTVGKGIEKLLAKDPHLEIKYVFVRKEKEKLPYPLHISVGWSRYEPGQSLEKLTELADEQLYLEKKRKNVNR